MRSVRLFDGLLAFALISISISEYRAKSTIGLAFKSATPRRRAAVGVAARTARRRHADPPSPPRPAPCTYARGILPSPFLPHSRFADPPHFQASGRRSSQIRNEPLEWQPHSPYPAAMSSMHGLGSSLSMGERGTQGRVDWLTQCDVHPNATSCDPLPSALSNRQRHCRVGWARRRQGDLRCRWCGLPVRRRTAIGAREGAQARPQSSVRWIAPSSGCSAFR
ncbi:hypothetical protein C8Q77DRAFT_653407 [Trametes polyzona]|nr:hypothetical protein C8Q77DRAFT_653407 [Trametes polyzona]